jgi:hypothetical protein
MMRNSALLSQVLEDDRRLFELTGDAWHGLRAVSDCLKNGADPPDWAKSALADAVHLLMTHQVGSLDEAFGHVPIKKRALASRRLQAAFGKLIVSRVLQKHADGRAIDISLFEEIGAELRRGYKLIEPPGTKRGSRQGLSATTCKKLHYAELQNLLAFAETLELLPSEHLRQLERCWAAACATADASYAERVIENRQSLSRFAKNRDNTAALESATSHAVRPHMPARKRTDDADSRTDLAQPGPGQAKHRFAFAPLRVDEERQVPQTDRARGTIRGLARKRNHRLAKGSAC